MYAPGGTCALLCVLCVLLCASRGPQARGDEELEVWCEQDRDCRRKGVDGHVECEPHTHVCQCVNGSSYRHFGCFLDSPGVGSRCTYEQDCLGAQARCERGLCQCPDTHVYLQQACRPLYTRTHAAPCRRREHCPPLHVCRTHTHAHLGHCACQDNLFFNGTTCTHYKDLYPACGEGRACGAEAGGWWYCGGGEDVCRAEAGRRELGERCRWSGECRGRQVRCQEGRCRCVWGQAGDGECLEECPPPRALYDGRCVELGPLGLPCRQHQHCTHTTLCQDGRCICPQGHLYDGERCVPPPPPPSPPPALQRSIDVRSKATSSTTTIE